METPRQSKTSGGLWNSPKAIQYSKGTQDMLRLMMEESRLTNLQRRRLNDCLENGAALPLTCDHTQTACPPQPKHVKSAQKRRAARPLRRSADSCRSGDSYVREQFRPAPIRDLEKEKRRLQNILATGQEEATAAPSINIPTCGGAADIDLYQEVLDEIEERRQFLADMASLGQEDRYIRIINSEISQRIRQLEVLDKTCSLKKDAVIAGSAVEKTTEQMDLEETGEEETRCH